MRHPKTRTSFALLVTLALAGSQLQSAAAQQPVASNESPSHSYPTKQARADAPSGAADSAHRRPKWHQLAADDGLNDAIGINRAEQSASVVDDKRLFVIELLQLLHEQYASTKRNTSVVSADATGESASKHSSSKRRDPFVDTKEDRQSVVSISAPTLSQLLEALAADGDMRRLTDWIQNSFNLATISEITTQFVVGKLASVNCAALLTPDSEDGLVPRFLLFNEHYVDVPYELPINPSPTECLEHARFDALRRTLVVVHGYLGGYTITDGLTNIKNRVLDMNALPLAALAVARTANGTYVPATELQTKLRQQLYNVIIVDWFNGANPVPRSRYIRAAVNSQVVGRLIARFLSALITRCGAPAEQVQILAHSLGK